MTASHPQYHQALPLPDSMQPESVRDWGWILGGILAACSWLWRKSLKRFVQFLRDCSAAPGAIMTLARTVDEIKSTVLFARDRGRMILNQSPMPIFESDSDGHCIFANAEMLRVLGKTIEQLRRDAWRSVVADEDRDRVFIEWESCVKDGRDFNMTYHWMDNNQTRILVRVTAVCVKEDGRPLGWLALAKVIF